MEKETQNIFEELQEALGDVGVGDEPSPCRNLENLANGLRSVTLVLKDAGASDTIVLAALLALCGVHVDRSLISDLRMYGC